MLFVIRNVTAGAPEIDGHIRGDHAFGLIRVKGAGPGIVLALGSAQEDIFVAAAFDAVGEAIEGVSPAQ